jgi:hypothetical protein
LTSDFLLSELTLQFQVSNGGFGQKTATLIYGVPEPTTLGLVGIGAMGLLARRRKARNLGAR